LYDVDDLIVIINESSTNDNDRLVETIIRNHADLIILVNSKSNSLKQNLKKLELFDYVETSTLEVNNAPHSRDLKKKQIKFKIDVSFSFEKSYALTFKISIFLIKSKKET
jgi:hypothetical protein